MADRQRIALEQLPREVVQTAQIVVGTDSAAATHEQTDALHAARHRIRPRGDPRAPRSTWRPAIPRTARNAAWAAEISDQLKLAGGPAGTRVIVRGERPHPGAQLSFTDRDGHRFLATLTDLEGDAF